MDLNIIANEIYESLPADAKKKLHELEELSKALGLTQIDPAQISIRLKQLQLRHQTYQSYLHKLETDLESLKAQRQDLSALSQELDTLQYKVDELQTLQNPDTTETITLKMQEYQMRLKKIPNQEGKLHGLQKFCDFVQDVQKWDQARKQVEELKERFSGLPPDLEAAKDIVKKAEQELEELMCQRDCLLNQLFPNRGKRPQNHK